MALAAAITITAISIGLLVIYGADVSVGVEGSEGFLPIDPKVRGFGLGIPSVILPIIGYFISRNDSSKGLGIMIIISGVLIMIGGLAVVGMTSGEGVDDEAKSKALINAGPLIPVGAFIIVLGGIKIKKSS